MEAKNEGAGKEESFPPAAVSEGTRPQTFRRTESCAYTEETGGWR